MSHQRTTWRKLYREITRREERLDLLVCNAGISEPKVAAEAGDATGTELRSLLWRKEDPAAWNDVFNTNVTSVYFTSINFLPLLEVTSRKEHMAGNVIVISSMSGIMRHSQSHFSYNAAKGATIHLTRLMSTEVEKTGVRVNSIAPGYFLSEMTTGESDEKQKSPLLDEISRANKESRE